MTNLKTLFVGVVVLTAIGISAAADPNQECSWSPSEIIADKPYAEALAAMPLDEILALLDGSGQDPVGIVSCWDVVEQNRRKLADERGAADWEKFMNSMSLEE